MNSSLDINTADEGWTQQLLRRFRWMLVGVSALFVATEILALTGIVPELKPVSLPEIVGNKLFAIGFGCPIVLYISSLPHWREWVKTVALGAICTLLLWACLWRVDWPPAIVGLGLGCMAIMMLRAWRGIGPARTNALLYLLPACVALMFTLQAGIFWYYIASIFPLTYDSYTYALDASFGFHWSFVIGRLFHDSPALKWICFALYDAPPPALVFVYALQLRSKRPPPIDVVTVLLAAGLIGYSFYFICPVAGPRCAFGQAFPNSPPPVESLLGQRLEVHANEDAPRNAMPSLHLASVILAYWHARPYGRWASGAAAVFVIGTFLATMGLGEHYFVDLVVALPFILAIQALCTPARGKSRPVRQQAFFGAAGLVFLWYMLLFFGTSWLVYRPVVSWGITFATAVAVWLLERRLYKSCNEEAEYG